MNRETQADSRLQGARRECGAPLLQIGFLFHQRQSKPDFTRTHQVAIHGVWVSAWRSFRPPREYPRMVRARTIPASPWTARKYAGILTPRAPAFNARRSNRYQRFLFSFTDQATTTAPVVSHNGRELGSQQEYAPTAMDLNSPTTRTFSSPTAPSTGGPDDQ